jgi:hypothetical protein
MAHVVVTKLELAEKIEHLPSHQFVGLRTKTIPKLNKKGRVTGLTVQEKLHIDPANIVKFSEFTAGMGYEYQHMIENRLIKEGKDVSEYQKGESWHVPYGDCKTIRKHKDRDDLYFYCFLVSHNVPKSEYVDFSTGKEIAKVELEEYLPVEKAPENQGLKEGNEVLVRTLKLESVYTLSAGGNEYSVRG